MAKIKNIILNFNGLGYNNVNQAKLLIYDKNNNLICKTNTYNSRVFARLKCNNIYKVVACTNNERISKNIYVSDLNSDYYFNFNNSLLNIVTFKLTDRNYSNLLIEKGTLNLWQKQ